MNCNRESCTLLQRAEAERDEARADAEKLRGVMVAKSRWQTTEIESWRESLEKQFTETENWRQSYEVQKTNTLAFYDDCEKLRARIAQLEAALREIASGSLAWDVQQEKARAALRGGEGASAMGDRPWLEIACPDCGAAVGKSCKHGRGAGRNRLTHWARVRDWRVQNERQVADAEAERRGKGQ